MASRARPGALAAVAPTRRSVMTHPDDNREPAASAATTDIGRVEPARIRFVDYRSRRSPNGMVFVEVELERVDGERVIGSASGQPSIIGDLRIAAEAAISALRPAVVTGQRFEIAGVKTVRAFDATVVLVSIVDMADPTAKRLLGSAFAAGDDGAAAVRAVLNATNRVLCKVPQDG